MLVERETFADENAAARAEKRESATGARANPVYLPAPHEVARAFYTAFKTPRACRASRGCTRASGTASR